MILNILFYNSKKDNEMDVLLTKNRLFDHQTEILKFT